MAGKCLEWAVCKAEGSVERGVGTLLLSEASNIMGFIWELTVVTMMMKR